jgi:hypothetical protein
MKEVDERKSIFYSYFLNTVENAFHHKELRF